MKKLVVTGAVLSCAVAIVMAQTQSQNAVGYVSEATPAAGGFEIVSVGVLGDGSNSVDIQDAIANLGDLNGAGLGQWDNADKIYVFTGSGYNTYGLWDDGVDTFWMANGTGWTKAGKASPSVASIDRGAAVWYETGTGGSAAALMTVGEVPDDGTYDISVGDFALVAYPYSATINLQDLVVSNGTGAGLGQWDNADKIYVFTGSGYNTYGLWDDGVDSFWMANGTGWTKAGKAAASDADLELGKGVWYESVTGAKTIGFTQNYTLD